MINQLAIFNTDGYKVSHIDQIPDNIIGIFSNLVARKSRVSGSNHIVVPPIKHILQDIEKEFLTWADQFAISTYTNVYETLFASSPSSKHLRKIQALADFLVTNRRLPVYIWTPNPGSIIPIGYPLMLIYSEHPFEWFGQRLETILSTNMWQTFTNATTAMNIRKILNFYGKMTSLESDFINYQAHDFSMRGHTSSQSAMYQGIAHLLFFNGTDTLSSVLKIHESYDVSIKGVTVPATEHAVMCIGTAETGEIETYRRLLNTYTTGIVSIVSDTYDYFKLINEGLRHLKNEILARNGKVVIRPDSGNPENIICGDPSAEEGSPEWLGSIRILDDIFGSALNAKGYKELNPKIGLIYGDSMTPKSINSILRRLASMGYASSNVVFGIGSYTYQYVSRDTYSMAFKAVGYVKSRLLVREGLKMDESLSLIGNVYNILKTPKTDPDKRSIAGVKIGKHIDGNYVLYEPTSIGDLLRCGWSYAYSPTVGAVNKDWEDIKFSLTRV